MTLEQHELGDCEKEEGYLCEECRQEYLELEMDRAMSQDDRGWEDQYA